MAADLNVGIIKKTQEILGKYVKRPALTEKLLKKPPFRFLHDVINAVIKDTGTLNGLYNEIELNSDNIKDRDSKIAFLQKLIDVIKIVTNENITTKPSKIVAGHEAEKTNEMLQMLGRIVDEKLDCSKAIETVNSGDSTTRPVKKQNVIGKEKKEQESEKKQPKERKPNVTKETSKPTDSSQVKTERLKETAQSKTKAAPKLNENKAKKDSTVVSRNKKGEKKVLNANAKSNQNPLKASARKSSEDEEQIKLSINQRDNKESLENIDESKKIELNGNEHLSIEANQFDSIEKKTDDAEEITVQNQNEMQHKIAELQVENESKKEEKNSETENPKSGKIPRASSGKRNMTRTDRSKSNENNEEKIMLEKKGSIELEKQDSNDATKKSSKKEDESNKMKNSSDAVHKNDKQNNKGKPVPLKRQSTFTRDESNDNETSVQSKTALRVPSARPISARPGAPRRRDKTNVEIVLQPNEQVKLAGIQVKLDSVNAELEDDGENLVIIETANSSDLNEKLPEIQNENKIDLDGDAQQGHLVHQILETQKELVQSNENQQNEIWDIETIQKRQNSAKQMNSLRDVIQNLTRSINPLGKLMDFIPEDLDLMQLEMIIWRDIYNQSMDELKKENNLTEFAIEPLKNQLSQINDNIKELTDIIDASRAKILQNSEKIRYLLLE